MMDKYRAGIFIRLPERCAKRIPDNGREDSPPHITLLYIGEIDEGQVDKLKLATGQVASQLKPFNIEATDYGEFLNPDDERIAHLIPRIMDYDGPVMSFEFLHALFRDAVNAVGISAQHHMHSAFKPHVTLKYIDDDSNYDGEVPQCYWRCTSVELWVDGLIKTRFDLGSYIEVDLDEAVRRHGRHAFEVGHNRKRKVIKDYPQAIQNRLNARKNLKDRIKKAADWHSKSSKGAEFHRDIAHYNRGNHKGNQVAKLAEAYAYRTVDDAFEAVLRKLIRLEAMDVIVDVDFDDNGDGDDIYLFLDPALSQREAEQVLSAIKEVNQMARIISTPEASVDSDKPEPNVWGVFIPYITQDGKLIPGDQQHVPSGDMTMAAGPTQTLVKPANDTANMLSKVIDFDAISGDMSETVFVFAAGRDKVPQIRGVFSEANKTKLVRRVEECYESSTAVYVVSASSREIADAKMFHTTKVAPKLYVS